MKIGLDWDGTVTVAPEPFLELTKNLMAAGHEVYIVTMRYPSEEGEIAQWRKHVTDVVFTKRLGKKKYCEKLGIKINIWIDDNPEAICKDGKEIWGFVTPEGFVDPHPVSDDVVIETTIAIQGADCAFTMAELSEAGCVLGQSLGTLCLFSKVSGSYASKHISSYELYRTRVSSEMLGKIMSVTRQGLKVPIIGNGGKVDIVDVKSIQSLDVLHKCCQVFNANALMELNFSEDHAHSINWDVNLKPVAFGPKVIEHVRATHYPVPDRHRADCLVVGSFYMNNETIKAARGDGFAGFADYKVFLIDQIFENFKNEDQLSSSLKIGYAFDKCGELVMWPE